ncbi:MAG: fibrillarin-like rRNA/tRNA 2'-O-methyltransferase [Candidatus Hadarchaeales archaeon]
MGELRWVEVGGRRRPATPNLCPGTKVYGEELVTVEGKEYRIWDPFRSKLAAALVKGLEKLPIREGSKVLYLGAASGTTASHVSDVVGVRGVVYCIEFSARSLRDLLISCGNRKNMVPILADARRPEEYRFLVSEVDVVYEDVAQPDQTEILLKNAEVFLKRGGYALLALKARAVDVTAKPKEVFEREKKKLEKEMLLIDFRTLEPFEKDHAMFLLSR